MCTVRMDHDENENGEGGDDGSPEEGDKLDGEEETESMTPTSPASPNQIEEDATSPPPSGDIPSPDSPRSVNDDAANDRELMVSPRCPSRGSTVSSVPPRCPSGESMLSDRGGLLRGVPLTTSTLSPVGVALPPTLPVAAAAALLPPQSAAMAAYLNAAAAAAHHSHRLMMTSPLPPNYNRTSVSPLISSSSSPPGILLNTTGADMPMQSPLTDSGILDFSKRSEFKNDVSDNDTDTVNFAKSSSPPLANETSPLDLSVSNRKRSSDDLPTLQPPRKQKAPADFKPQVMPQWPPPVAASHLPYFAAAVAAASSISPKPNNNPELWNGKLKHSTPTPSDATKALEKMSELSKLGGDDLFRANASINSSVNSRHSAWQSHWLNKGAEQAKDVLKCVWCKQSFPSLAAMTTHMKEAKHCGVNVPVPPIQSQNLPPHQPQISSPSNSNTSTSSSAKPSQSDLNLLIKETMPLPRKLVRGQDVWLGKGAEQTRQILKCMWCGQSFRSLAEMTSHMQQTQHYTNIISQEQIISWRSSDDAKGGGGGSGSGNNSSPSGGASSHVSAVLTCKVCDQAFSSLKELSNHMVKNSHYKEHIMRSITESGGRRRQTREKRKKSLPVRKLLELERAQHEFKNGDTGSIVEKLRDASGVGRITCEKCGNKIETSLFVDHIRQCVGGGNIGNSQKNFLKTALMSSNIIPPESQKLKAADKSPSPVSQRRSPTATDLTTKETNSNTVSESNNGSSPSVLNAIEKLIEKSFDSRTRQNPAFPGHGVVSAPMGSSILKRLGIDESVDYTKPLVDVQTMNLLRNYHHQQAQHYGGKRERSGSESSSVSERGSSRMDASTPERRMEPPGIPFSSNTPRSTPDKREKSPIIENSESEVAIKKEIDDDDDDDADNDEDDNDNNDDDDGQNKSSRTENHIRIKREKLEENDEDDRGSMHSNEPRVEEEEKQSALATSPKEPGGDGNRADSPCHNSVCSPASSDRSGTPRSANGDRKSGGSLGALSSMFDSLSGGGSTNDTTANSSGKRGSSHPLAALQKLCDKTETHTNNRTHVSSNTTAINATNSSNSSTPNSATTPGAILAFSWACNDAVVTPDSIMKCAFCDTPFISKGAYRHHLSKMHFVKDGVIPDPVSLKGTQPSSSGSVSVPVKGMSSGALGSSESKSPPAAGSYEESPHSKFLKYTELAKQLSSKYV